MLKGWQLHAEEMGWPWNSYKVRREHPWRELALGVSLTPAPWGRGSRAYPAAPKGFPVLWADAEPRLLSVVTACLTQCKITPCSTLEGILHGCRVTSWYRINGVQQILRYLLWRLIFHCRYLLPTKLYSQVWNLKQYCVQSTRIQNSLSSCWFTLNHRACTKEKWKSSNLLLTHGF